MRHSHLIAPLIALAVAGCAGSVAAPTDGAEIPLAQKAVQARALNPQSVQFAPGGMTYALSNGERAVCLAVNAENAFGGMTGYQVTMVNLRAGRHPIVMQGEAARYECARMRTGTSSRL